MPKSKKDKGLLEEKTVLIDTCLLINALHSTELFQEFFDFIKNELQSIPVIISPIYIEFINGIPRDQQIEGVKGSNIDRLQYSVSFLEKMTKEVEINECQIGAAKMLSNLNSLFIASGEFKDWYKKELPKPSFVDHLIGAMSFHEDIVIATLDNSDFSLYLYDRLYLKTFDLKDEIYTIGFYKINGEKYAELVDFASKIIKLTSGKTKKSGRRG